MVNLPDLGDIDRILCRGREKFDLGFTCNCQRQWCALMNNPEGIQNPGVSATSLPAGLADSEVRLVAVTCGVSTPQGTCFCPSFPTQLHCSERAGKDVAGSRLGREEERKWNRLDTRSCLARGTDHVSLSLIAGKKNQQISNNNKNSVDSPHAALPAGQKGQAVL